MEIAGYCGQESAAIVLYKKVWEDPLALIERLEAGLGATEDPTYNWQPALVGDSESMPEYRDCSDFKIAESFNVPSEHEDLWDVYQEVITGVRECVSHYTSLYNLGELEYEEATNFVKYEKGQHFAVHPDSGFSYSCVVSAIGYLNSHGSDYEGGEYLMPYQDIKFLPEAGDVIIHPSNFVYAHASLPVSEGVKYSAVTMYDYNDRNHQAHGYAVSPYDLPSAGDQITKA